MRRVKERVRKIARTEIKSLREIADIAAQARRVGKVVVTTNGCFDIIHPGHVRSLEAAKLLGDLLIVGVNSDVSVRLNKGPGHPIMPQAERAEVVAALATVDFVVVFDSKTLVGWLKKVKPSIHAKGRDRKMLEIVEKEIVERYGGTVRLIPYFKGYSTTAFISKILK